MKRYCVAVAKFVASVTTFYPVVIAMAVETDVDVGLTGVYQDADRSGIDSEWTFSADLVLTAATGNGVWTIHFEGSTKPHANSVSAFYPTANADAGSVLNRDGDGGVQISEFSYMFSLNGNRSLALGLIDPSAWLDQSSVAGDENSQFLNGGLNQNATIEFPDYSVGAVFRMAAPSGRPNITVVIAGSDGVADLPDRSYQDLLNLTSDERGVFVGVGATWNRSAWSYGVGSWARSDDHSVLGSNDQEKENNYGAYANADWADYGHALSLRIGAAKERVSVANRFVAIAYRRELSIGVFGAGVARTSIANEFRQRDLDDVTAAELFLRFPIASGKGHITPSIQHVENPGFDGSGAAISTTATVASVRLHWYF